MYTRSELRKVIQEESNVWYQIACDYYKISPKPLTIDFDLNGRTAGMAYSNTNRIRYNLELAYVNQDDFIKRTVPHEVAHLIAESRHPYRVGHGLEWKLVMMAFGLPATRCHTYDVMSMEVKTRQYFKYTCPCSTNHTVGLNLHKKLQRPNDRHYCRICKGKLTLV